MTKEEDYSIFNKEVIGGLKSAVERGESLKEAMMTFYQAGYDKNEIESAAREFLDEQNRNPQPNATNSNSALPKVQSSENQRKTTNSSFNAKTIQKKNLSPPNSSNQQIKKFPSFRKNDFQPKQKVSAYGISKKPKIPKSNTLTIALAIILFLLLGVLLVIFVYKDSFVNFINGLFH